MTRRVSPQGRHQACPSMRRLRNSFLYTFFPPYEAREKIPGAHLASAEVNVCDKPREPASPITPDPGWRR